MVSQENGPAAAARARSASRSRSAGSLSSSPDRGGEGGRIARRHEPARAVLLDQLAKAAHVREQHRLPEGEPGEQHSGDVDRPVRQDQQIRAAKERGQLGVAHVAGHQANVRRSVEGHAQRAADDPQLGIRDRAEGLDQHVRSLVGPHHAEEEHHRLLDGRQLGRQRALVGLAGQVLEGAVRDDVYARPAAEQLGALAGVHDDRVHAIRETPAGASAADDVVHRQHLRPLAREHPQAERLEPHPLPVDQIGARRPAAQAQRVGHVLGELERAAKPGAPSLRSAWPGGRRTR